MLKDTPKIRQPHFANDLWYSSAADNLQADLQTYLSHPTPPPSGLLGLVAPHAGYVYSGHVAGAAFAGLTPSLVDTVILIGPDHHGAAPGAVSTVQAEAWRTPLGDIPVNWELLARLQARFPITLLADDDEHSLEIELPFLQSTLEKFSLVPLMMGDQSLETCLRLAEALIKILSPLSQGEGAGVKVLLVASSDLSHYFDDDTARQLDQTTLQFILNLDAAGLVKHVEAGRRRGQPYACGAGPIAVVIQAAQGLGATRATLRKYATSGDISPHKERVVGYAAVAID